MAGRNPFWGSKKTGRTVAGHQLVLRVDARLQACGLTRDDRKAVKRAVAETQLAHQEYKRVAFETLRGAYYVCVALPALPMSDEDRWTSIVLGWGKPTKRRPACMSAKEAREIVNRLIEVGGSRWRSYLDQLFVHMEHRIHWNGRRKIKWLREVIDRLAAKPLDWPIPVSRRGRPDVLAAMIEDYVNNARRAHKSDIVALLAPLGTSADTAQTTLSAMVRAGRITRLDIGVYGPCDQGARAHVPAHQAIANMVAAGPATFPDLTKTGHSKSAIRGGILRLKKEGRINVTKGSRKGGDKGYATYTRPAGA
jgi:hypothetical protein